MTRQLVIVVTDDLCGDEFLEADAVEVSLTWAGTEYVLDLCGGCQEAITEMSLGEILTKARKIKRPKKVAAKDASGPRAVRAAVADVSPDLTDPSPHTCECGRAFTTSGGLTRHRTRSHG